MPWHYAIDTNLFHNEGIDLQWVDFPGGTGAMANSLKNNEIDMAIMLTEGAIVDIENGAENTILGFFVKSPLLWGIHVAAYSQIKHSPEIFSKRYAISRMGSGSHLMALLNAAQNTQKIDDNQFVIVQNIEGATKALANNDADVFLWEKFMTSSYVESGVFRRIGEIPTPWPCFVLVAKNKFLEINKAETEKIKSIICNVNSNFIKLPNLPQLIADKFNLKIQLVNEWLNTVEWNSSMENDFTTLSNIKRMLTNLKII